MNNVIPPALKSELDAIKNEVRGLRGEIQAVLENMKKQQPVDDISPQELMHYASHVFQVTDEATKDDDNIAHPEKIKPVDFSPYV